MLAHCVITMTCPKNLCTPTPMMRVNFTKTWARALIGALLVALPGLLQASVWPDAAATTGFLRPSALKLPRHCVYSHCPKIREVKVCFLMQNLPDVPYDIISTKSIAQPNCGLKDHSEVVQVSSVHDIKNWFRKLATQCKKVKQMVLFGHGRPGQLYNTSTEIIEPEAFRAFRCTAAPGVSVITSGCHVGLGCQGALFFRRWRKAFFQNGGSIAGPRSWAVAFLPGLVPSAATSWLKLNYSQGRERWSIVRPHLFSKHRPSLLYENNNSLTPHQLSFFNLQALAYKSPYLSHPAVTPSALWNPRPSSRAQTSAHLSHTASLPDPVQVLCRNQLLDRVAVYQRLLNFYSQKHCLPIDHMYLSAPYLQRLKLIAPKAAAHPHEVQLGLQILKKYIKKIRLHCSRPLEYKDYVGAF